MLEKNDNSDTLAYCANNRKVSQSTNFKIHSKALISLIKLIKDFTFNEKK